MLCRVNQTTEETFVSGECVYRLAVDRCDLYVTRPCSDCGVSRNIITQFTQREKLEYISIVDPEAVGFGEIITRMEIFKAVLRECETYANTRQ